MDDQGRAFEGFDLVEVAKSLGFRKPDAIRIDPQQTQQRGGPGKTAFDDQPVDLPRVGGGQFQHGGTAQRTAHEDEGA